MPIYEYICPDCGLTFELLRSLSEDNGETPCPRCQKSAKRKLSTFASFSKDESGLSTPVAGTGSSCSSCSSSSCSTCGL
ncbi:zinc ribbon domain-containing protein [Chloroflexota bacterium]